MQGECKDRNVKMIKPFIQMSLLNSERKVTLTSAHLQVKWKCYSRQ